MTAEQEKEYKELIEYFETQGTPEEKQAIVDYIQFLEFKRYLPQIKKHLGSLNFIFQKLDFKTI